MKSPYLFPLTRPKLHCPSIVFRLLPLICNIYKNPSKGFRWDEFRVKDIKSYNDVYQDLLLYFKDKKFNVENVKEWLNI